MNANVVSESSYEPPMYDEATGMLVQQPPPQQRAQRGPRQGVSRGSGGDRYVALGNDDDEVVHQQTAKANDIALRRQREHAAAFQRQMQAEEDYARSSAQQTARDHEIAAQLAAQGDGSMDAIQQSQRDAEMAVRLQREMDQQVRPTRKQKVVRVLVPQGAQAGDSLAVNTPTTGKFEVKVPGWARPGHHFDCHVTTIIQVTPAGQRPSPAQERPSNPLVQQGYQPPGQE